MGRHHWAWLLAGAGLLAAAVTAPQAPARVSYSKDVLPIFRAQCYSCHSEGSGDGGLDLDTPAAIAKGGDSGKLLVPGDPDKSLLMQRLHGHGGLPRMPKGFAPLSQAQMDTIARWIREGASTAGAEGAAHWSYRKPRKPESPQPKSGGWARGPIDQFILHRLEQEGVRPSPPADSATLVRRLHLDLTGLPPTPQEVQAYLNDRAPDAYERLVDRLLASPHYGEKMAMPWLDLARYADTNGFEKDTSREIWAYRDYVIRAFNRDLGYDQFTIEQLAGDLLPEPTKDQLIATGFQRNTMLNEEGGVDKGEQRWLTLVDRAGVTGTVWLSTSVACAQCHDHKYDPVSQEDFFRMLAFYESSDEPTLDLAGPDVQALRQQVKQLEDQAKGLTGAAADAVKATIASLQARLARMPSGSTLILREKPGARAETLFRNKGSYLQPAQMVGADAPKFLPPLPAGSPKNRLGLAQWLVSRDNPLTARVAVNRVWEQLFGQGIVRTSDDFGTQGEPPSHPELLDWLAVEFMDQRWSFKALIRQIVTSSAYRQSSDVRPDLAVKDPLNRLVARQSRHRLRAEEIRDASLSAAGLLSRKIGGPSVMPDQPDGIWNSPYSGEYWQRSEGENRWRRGLYTFWKRTAAYPSFMAFDATSREACTTKRIPTNTALQALTLLNDVVVLEASRTLSSQALGTSDPIGYAFRRVLARLPQPEERARLERLLREQTALYAVRPDQAKAITGRDEDPQKAAMALLAQTLLNLDEAITRE